MTPATAILAGLCVAAVVTLWLVARHDGRSARLWRAGLLDEAAEIFPGGCRTFGRDGFPRFSVAAEGHELVFSVIADTLVTRRLPQLWLALEVRSPTSARSFSIGALARPTGAEFYALTHDLTDWLPPPGGDLALLMRGKNAGKREAEKARRVFMNLFADPRLKEAVVLPAGLRVLRQIVQGESASHLLLRQPKFPISRVPVATLRTALEDIETLAAAFDGAARDKVPAALPA